jgi:hypothetical protein
LLSVFVILAWGGVGDPAWSGMMAPSREGLLDASTHVGRLLLVLMAVAVLRERMPMAELLIATHRLLDPLRRCGLDTDRGLVRLLLVLHYLETMPRPRDWRQLLEPPASSGQREIFELTDRQLSSRDYLDHRGCRRQGSCRSSALADVRNENCPGGRVRR